jgi:hypothetical protein
MSKKKRRKALGEDAAMALVLKSHPEYRRQFERGTLPHEIIGEDGEPMNPHLHLSVHVIVERQLAADDPKGVVAVARELEQLGVDKHEIRHAIGRAVANQLWLLSHEGREFDVDVYMADLREIIDFYR